MRSIKKWLFNSPQDHLENSDLRLTKTAEDARVGLYGVLGGVRLSVFLPVKWAVSEDVSENNRT